MESFRALSNFYITGRGRVFVVANPSEQPREALAGRLVGAEVLIDGVVMRVHGVDSHATPIIRAGDGIGLLVDA